MNTPLLARSAGILLALGSSIALAQGQPQFQASPTSGTGTVSPAGTVSAPGSIVTPGSPTIPAPSVPRAMDTPIPPSTGASMPTNPEAGSLSGSVDQRNRGQGDTLGQPAGQSSLGSGTSFDSTINQGRTTPSTGLGSDSSMGTPGGSTGSTSGTNGTNGTSAR